MGMALTMRTFKSVLVLGALALALCAPAFDAAAQFFGPGGPQGPTPKRAGPEPANNRQMAMTGRQIVGLGGKCLQSSGLKFIMNTCQTDSISQRFKFENGRLMTAGVIVVNDFNMADEAWMHACFSIADRDHEVYLGFCRVPGMGGADRQVFTFNGREIRGYGNQCLDVAGGRTDLGAPVIYWGCNGDSNQQWAWR